MKANNIIGKAVTAILRGEDKSEAARLAFFTAHIKPLIGADGRIDWLSGNGAETRNAIKAATVSWYVSAPRVVDGVVYETAALKAALAPKAVKGAVYKAANRAINLKVWRYTGGLMADYGPKADKAEGRAPHGKVATAKARSAAGKAKANKAAAPAAPESVPALVTLLCDAIAKLKPQSRIAAANQVMDDMRNIIKVARHAMETAPRKPSKANKADKADKAAAPASVAIQ